MLLFELIKLIKLIELIELIELKPKVWHPDSITDVLSPLFYDIYPKPSTSTDKTCPTSKTIMKPGLE